MRKATAGLILIIGLWTWPPAAGTAEVSAVVPWGAAMAGAHMAAFERG